MYYNLMLKKLFFPIDNNLNYCIEIWKSLDGLNYGFFGQIEYFRTKGEAEKFAIEFRKTHTNDVVNIQYVK